MKALPKPLTSPAAPPAVSDCENESLCDDVIFSQRILFFLVSLRENLLAVFIFQGCVIWTREASGHNLWSQFDDWVIMSK